MGCRKSNSHLCRPPMLQLWIYVAVVSKFTRLEQKSATAALWDWRRAPVESTRNKHPTVIWRCQSAVQWQLSVSALHLVIATKVHLQMHLTSNGRDSATIGQRKSHLMTQLLHYFTMTDIHAVAKLVDSRMRNNTDVMRPDLKTRGISTLQTSKNDDRICAEWTRWKCWSRC